MNSLEDGAPVANPFEGDSTAIQRAAEGNLETGREVANRVRRSLHQVGLPAEVVIASLELPPRDATRCRLSPRLVIAGKCGRIGRVLKQQHGDAGTLQVRRTVPLAARRPLTEKPGQRGVATHAVDRIILRPRRSPYAGAGNAIVGIEACVEASGISQRTMQDKGHVARTIRKRSQLAQACSRPLLESIKSYLLCTSIALPKVGRG